jgi:hypothetical protein
MPTLADIANQINNTLTQINTNTQDTATSAAEIKGDTADIKLRLDAIKSSIDGSTVVLAGGLFAILEQLKLSNVLLKDNVEQNQTIVCWLKTADDLLCRILHVLQSDTAIQTTIRDAVVDLDAVIDLVHAREALEVERLGKLKRQIEVCCPPEQPKPEKCFDPCREPALGDYQPKGSDWTPPRRDNPPVPGVK